MGVVKSSGFQMTSVPNVRVFQFVGPLLYTNSTRFKTQLSDLTGISPKLVKKELKKRQKEAKSTDNAKEKPTTGREDTVRPRLK